MEEKNKKILLVVTLVIVLFALAIFSGYLLAKRGRNQITEREGGVTLMNEKFQINKATIMQMTDEGNNYSEAIDKISQLLKEKQFATEGQEADLKIYLAMLYMNSQDENNFKKGIDLLKETANDTNYPSVWRSIALERLAHFVTTYDASFAKKNIFDDIYFSAMLKEEDLGLAQRKLYEKSLSLYESVIPYYKVANWYALQLLADKAGVKNLSAKETRENYLQAARMNLKKGEDLFNESYPKDTWDDERLVTAYQSYAEATTKLYLLKEFEDSQKIIDSFDKAIAIYEKRYDIQGWPIAKSKITRYVLRLHLPFLIYSYASSLAVMQKPVNQDKIQSLLGILYDKDWQEENNVFNHYAYLKNQKEKNFDNTYIRYATLSLAKADIRFANLLAELGWTKEAINKFK